MGVLERGKGKKQSKVRTSVLPNRKKHAEAGSALYTDALLSYAGLGSEYAHQVIDHAVQYVDG